MPDSIALDQEIQRLLTQMSTTDGYSVEYTEMVKNLGALYEARNTISKPCISSDAFYTVAGNLLGILMILNSERANVITSKAIGFVMKPKV
jgi:hypothetical protein